MNKEQMSGKADQITGKIKQAWGKLTDDDIALYHGKRDEFVGKLKESYGLEKEEAHKRLKEMEDSVNSAPRTDRDAA